MPDLRFDQPETTKAFADILSVLGHPLPWTTHGDELVYDANDVCVVEADPFRLGSDDDGRGPHLAGWVVCAMNTCGGFQAEGA